MRMVYQTLYLWRRRYVVALCICILLHAQVALGQLPPGFQLEEVVSEANIPVALAPAPDGRLFYAELLTGSIRIVEDGELTTEPFVTVEVATSFDVKGFRGLGLLDLTLDPEFSDNGFVYMSYSPTPDEIVVARLQDVDGVGKDHVELLRQPGSGSHNGGRLRFAHDGTLFVTRGDTRFPDFAQDPEIAPGKIIRINPDGSIPQDNPIPNSPIYALGVRNSFGIAIHPLTGQPFFSENGPTSDDEINILVAGGNYGWPVCVGACNPPNQKFIDPLVSFTPNICPTGMDFYTAETFPEQFRHDLFFTDCNTGRVQRLKVVPPYFDQVGLLEDFFAGGLGGTLDVKTGADGNLYFSTFDAVFRIVPPDAGATAGLQGSVTRDAAGKVIPLVGATIKLKQKESGRTVFQHRTISDAMGRYAVTGLSEGTYVLVVKQQGFVKGKVKGIMLESSEMIDVDVRLEPVTSTGP